MARGAAETMFRGYYLAFGEYCLIKLRYFLWCFRVHREVGGKVKITIIQGSVPSDVDLMTTHQGRDCRWVKRSFEQFQVLLLFPFQDGKESTQGHVR